MTTSFFRTGVRMKTTRFSLAELILLGTVGLGFFALFIPAFYNSRQKSKTAACVDQLGRMLGNSVSNYTAQNDGYLPIWEYGWVKALAEVNGSPVDQTSLPQGDWACPAQGPEASDPTIDAATWWRGSHYGLNQHITSGRTRSDGTALPMWTRVNKKREAAPSWRRVKSPQSKILGADAAGGNILGIPNMDPVISGSATKGRGCSFALPPRPLPGLPYRRHANGTVNVLFLDFHVSTLSRFPEFMMGRGTEGYDFWHGEQWYPESGEQEPPKLTETRAPKTDPSPKPTP